MLSLCEESNLRRDLRRLDFCTSDLLEVEEEEDDPPSPREKVDERALRKLARRDGCLLSLSPLLDASSNRTDMVEGGCNGTVWKLIQSSSGPIFVDEDGDANRPLRLFTNQPIDLCLVCSLLWSS